MIENINIDSFIEQCVEYNKINNTNVQFEICPVHLYASQHNRPCHDVRPGTKDCKLCGKPLCPVCGNHNVSQVSRVTGYMSDVGGWNEAKKQELKDRKKYNIEVNS